MNEKMVFVTFFYNPRELFDTIEDDVVVEARMPEKAAHCLFIINFSLLSSNYQQPLNILLVVVDGISVYHAFGVEEALWNITFCAYSPS